jgi:uncharacterized membrane protein YdbT with pleckstrin-like domain
MQNPTLSLLRPSEEIRLVLRRHWIIFVPIVAFFLAMLFLWALVISYRDSIGVVIGGTQAIDIMLVLFWCVVFLILYVQWTNAELDMFIITNQRIIGLEQIAFLNRLISECAIDKVQEVNSQTKGLFENILNFGSIKIHTASEESEFIMPYVADPLENARRILNVIQEGKK